MTDMQVIGRDDELATGNRFLDAVHERAGCLLVAGEAGVGKTTVWEALVESALARRYSVLSCRAAASEASLSLAALSDLVDPVAADTIPFLPEPQRRALEAALLLVEPNGFRADWRAVGTGLRTVLERLAGNGPVVVAVDDVQWIDSASARALEFAARRVPRLPIGFLLAARTTEAYEIPFELERALPVERLELGPLSAAALYQLISTRLGTRLNRPTLLRIETASAGNPFFALELARVLADTDGQLPPGEPLPLPPTLTALVAERVRALPAPSRTSLLYTAAHGSPTVELVVAASGRARAADALERAQDAGVVTITGSDIRFAHPLLAAAVLAESTAAEKRLVHRRLAAKVEDPEARARHLALGATGPDERVARALDAAAERAAARGAPQEAAELCALAAGLTPKRNVAERTQRELAESRHLATTGAYERARLILDRVLDELPRGPGRAEVLLVQAAACRDDYVEMTELCERALDESGDDAHLQARILERLAAAWHIRGNTGRALVAARAGLELAEYSGDDHLYLMLVAGTGLTETWSSEITPGLLERGAALEAEHAVYLPFEQSPGATLGVRSFYLGRMDEARELLEAAYRRATDAADETSRVTALLQLSALECFAGDWDAAARHADAGIELDGQLGSERGVLLFYRGLVAACLGEVELARELAAAAEARARAVGEDHVERLSVGLAGFVELSLGNADEAARILTPLMAADAAGDEPRTSRYFDDGIEALVAVGDVDRAREFSDLYSRAADASPVPVVRAKAARCRGLVHAAAGDLEAAVTDYDRSLGWHDEASQPFDRARALLSLGLARRRMRQKRVARETLEEALEILDRLPAPLWSERARAELARVGQRREDSHELSETELRVAELAAEGLRNREIAARAFLTPKSVEDVLGRVYRKLDIRSRAQLGAVMAERRSASGSPDTSA